VRHRGAERQGLLKESSRPRCSIARGLTVINESLNVGKHFISASSVFIRQGQPLAGRERAVTFITTTQEGETERPPIGLIKKHQLDTVTDPIPYYYNGMPLL